MKGRIWINCLKQSRMNSFLRLRSGMLSDEQMGRVTSACQEIEDLPLHIIYRPDLSLMQLKSLVKRTKVQHSNLELVVVDYIQLIPVEGRFESRQQAIAEISRQLKLLAGEAGIVMLAISQLNRAVEVRQDKRPMLSDLRESGCLEQDADMVAFVYRPGLYDEEEDQQLTELIIRKQRNGPVGTVYFRLVPSQMRLVEHERNTKRGGVMFDIVEAL